MDYKIHRLDINRLKDVQYLFRKVVRSTVAIAHLQQKYHLSENGFLGFLAYLEGHPIGFVGLMPGYFTYQGKQELAGQMVDIMILPDYRHAGVATCLCQHLITLAETSNITFVWAFANEKSEPLVRSKLGFELANRITAYFWNKPGSGILARLRRKMAAKKKLNWKQMFQEYLVPDFPGNTFSADRVVMFRDSGYMASKLKQGSLVIRVKDAFFWLKAEQDILIGDMWAEGEKELREGLETLLGILKKRTSGMIYFQSSPGHMAKRVCEQLAAERLDTWALVFKDHHSTFPLDQLAVTLADIDTF